MTIFVIVTHRYQSLPIVTHTHLKIWTCLEPFIFQSSESETILCFIFQSLEPLQTNANYQENITNAN